MMWTNAAVKPQDGTICLHLNINYLVSATKILILVLSCFTENQG